MATRATATKIHGPWVVGGAVEYTFLIESDTADSNGQMNLDLTDYFTDLIGIQILGMTASSGYFVDVQKPAYGTDITSTNVKLGVYEAGADAGPLDPKAGDMSTILAGLTIKAFGTGKD